MHQKRMAIRWRDLDAYGHVNNAVYLTYLEELLDEWLAATITGPDGLAEGFLTARVAIDYRRELRLADKEVIGRCALARIGTSSVTLRTELRAAAGELVAEAEVVLVARDASGRGSRPLTEDERQALEPRLAPDAEALGAWS